MSALAAQSLVQDINPNPGFGSNPFGFTRWAGRVFFTASDGTHGSEPWSSDGTPAGTRLLADNLPGLASSRARFAVLGDQIFLLGSDGGIDSLLWRSDGTTVGTTLITTIPGVARAALRAVEPLGRLFFAIGNTLWVSDGTAAGTTPLRTFNVRSLHGFPLAEFTAFAGLLHFVVEDNVNVEMWQSDGTVAGTVRFTSGPGFGSVPQGLTVVGDRMFFSARTDNEGDELWLTDGTVAGTRLVADIVPGAFGSVPRRLTAAGDRLFFVAGDQFSNFELWTSDGTAAGTRLVRDINPAGASDPQGITPLADGRVFFFAKTPGEGREPWVSDGTSAGTTLVADVRPGTADSMASPNLPSQVAVVGSGRIVLFAADDGVAGAELWRSDGTGSGTRRLTDVNPGAAAATPADIVLAGTTVLFTALEPSLGRELWGMPLAATGDSLAEPFGKGCSGTGSRVPALRGDGVPSVGNASFGVHVRDALAGAPAVLLFSTGRRPLALGTCVLELALPAADLPFAIGAVGSQRLALPIPAHGSLHGQQLFLQSLVVDPAGSFVNLLAFSNALHLVFGD